MAQRLKAGRNWSGQARKALVFIRPYRVPVAVVMGLTLAGAALEALEPLVMKYFFDKLGSGVERALLTGVGSLLFIGIVREGLNGVSNWMAWKVRTGVNYALLEATVSRLHSLPLAYHRKESVGGIMTKMDRGINGLVGALAELAFNVLPGVVYLVLSLAVMFRLDWRLSLVVLFFAPLPALIGMRASAEQTQRERTLMNRWSRIFSRLNEVLSGIVTVKCFVMEDSEEKRFLKDVRGANDVVLRGVGTDTKVGAAKNLVTMLARIIAIALGGYLVFRGEITVGTVVAFLGYVGGLFGPVQGLTGIYQTLRKATVALDTVFSILDAHDPMSDAPDARAIAAVRGEVFFDAVSFGYQGGKSILQDICIQVKPGETVALVGPSGAGKTTLMSLLQRLYEPSSGSIRVDGVDISRLKQRSLRRQIGVVSQDAVLFNDTVLNNIAYGSPWASYKEIEEAARMANAHDFVLRLPEGYGTVVGERGGCLSSGERQRITIARALLKNPPLLILDEATSALDAESEALVQEALARLVRGRTTFVIAHRLSTVVGADRILVLKDGRIIENGTHHKLMNMGGYYASLVQRQTCGLLLSEAA
ncbi:MAG: ABC transporter ATP-binding protein [Thermodesulfovibrionales bacterium]